VSHWDVAVDGALQAPLVVTGDTHPYVVATGPGTHDVVLTKRTETSLGVTTFHGIEPLPGASLVPSPAPNGRRIEFVGDSITCGYGVLGADATCTFSADTESEPSAWASLASKALGALHTSVCWSGLGVYRNFDGQTTDTMPERYGRAIGDEAESAWPPTSFEPDAVVVGLGTNDFAGGKGDPGQVFTDTYAAFLATVRAAHPASAIVLATSPMLSTPNHELHRARLVAAMEMRAAAGDTNLSLLDIPAQDEADGLGCGFHPSKITQQKMATMLVAHLKQTLGW
jgi:lysophospholipase L1-like esterase